MLTNDNQSLIHKPLQDRRLVLYNHFHEVSGEIQFATHMEGNDTEQIQAFLLESVNHGCEGLMVKTLTENATYEPSKRSLNWLKVGFCWNSENSLKKIISKSQGIRWISCQLGDIMGKVKEPEISARFYWLVMMQNQRNFRAFAELESIKGFMQIGTGFSDDALKQYSDFYNNGNLATEKPPTYKFGNAIQLTVA